jgi:hypothetical protein
MHAILVCSNAEIRVCFLVQNPVTGLPHVPNFIHGTLPDSCYKEFNYVISFNITEQKLHVATDKRPMYLSRILFAQTIEAHTRADSWG